MTPENKSRAKFLLGLALGIGSGLVIGKEYVSRQTIKHDAKEPNVPWTKSKKVNKS